MGAYYNENDPKKAAALRELIKWGLIAPGEVDERSIEDVRPDELAGFTQCHFFAGAGIWSYALRLAGWPDDRPVWTGSCPCPSFSAAGKGEGFEDARHLWPAWHRLISECGPATVFGEQVEAAIGYGWIDLVQTDLEAKAYAFGKIVLGACSVGAPHIRLRVYFVADSQSLLGRREQSTGSARGRRRGPARDCTALRGSESMHAERQHGLRTQDGRSTWIEGDDERPETGDGGESECEGLEGHFGDVRDWRGPGWLDPITARSVAAAGATRGFWADCDWWYGRDGKYRPIGPGLFPLAHGTAARVVRLRCYGDGIVPQVAQAFIEAYLEI